ncbi:hypothetical protein HDV00_006893 [Rhizophlyctis rosea]|nr:hypothetical protein HDV00_006893 [Rhizophlyctis rosea]
MPTDSNILVTSAAVLAGASALYLALTRIHLRRIRMVSPVPLPTNLATQNAAFARLAFLHPYYDQFNTRNVTKGEKYDFKIVSETGTQDLGSLTSGKEETVIYDLHHQYKKRLIITEGVERRYTAVLEGDMVLRGQMSDEFMMFGMKVKWDFLLQGNSVAGQMTLDGPAWVVLLCGPLIRRSLGRRLEWIRQDAEAEAKAV